jgi:hypothetical protein
VRIALTITLQVLLIEDAVEELAAALWGRSARSDRAALATHLALGYLEPLRHAPVAKA